MKTYVARLATSEAERSREIVGLFTADSEERLFWLVDECCDPHAVEVCEILSGGIYWDSQVGLKLPISLSDEGEALSESDLPSGGVFTGGWADAFLGDDASNWRPIRRAAQ